jgi:hypothetical protein
MKTTWDVQPAGFGFSVEFTRLCHETVETFSESDSGSTDPLSVLVLHPPVRI